MDIIGIIPARMGSSRFPGKPMAEILGKPMIFHVYHRSRLSRLMKNVYIATCDKEIEDYCLKNNIGVVMTKDTHERASDRAAEAMLNLEEKNKRKIDIVVMIQGDEPMLVPEMIDLAVEPVLKDKSILVSNLMSRINNQAEHQDPNTIKVVIDRQGFALYFSREPIPTVKRGKGAELFKQVCIIPFKRDFLIKFNALTSTPLEITESVDMLRVLEHGYKVKMVYSAYDTYSVDTPEDLRRVEKLMQNDSLLIKYMADKL